MLHYDYWSPRPWARLTQNADSCRRRGRNDSVCCTWRLPLSAHQWDTLFLGWCPEEYWPVSWALPSSVLLRHVLGSLWTSTSACVCCQLREESLKRLAGGSHLLWTAFGNWAHYEGSLNLKSPTPGLHYQLVCLREVVRMWTGERTYENISTVAALNIHPWVQIAVASLPSVWPYQSRIWFVLGYHSLLLRFGTHRETLLLHQTRHQVLCLFF